MKKLMIAAAAAAMVGGAFANCIDCVHAYRIKLAGKTCVGKSLTVTKSGVVCSEDCWLKPASYRVAGYFCGTSSLEEGECSQTTCACQEDFIGQSDFWDENKKQVEFSEVACSVFDILRVGGDKNKAQICITLDGLNLAGFGKISYQTYDYGMLKQANGFFAGTLAAPKCSSCPASVCGEEVECEETASKIFKPCTLEEAEAENTIAFGRWNLQYSSEKSNKIMKTGSYDCLYPAAFSGTKKIGAE